VIFVWVALAAAFSITAWGLWRMTVEGWVKSYLLVSWLFMVSSTFTLAKMLRDRHEADLMARTAAAERAERGAAGEARQA